MSAEEEESKTTEDAPDHEADMLDNDDGFVSERRSHSAGGGEVVIYK